MTDMQSPDYKGFTKAIMEGWAEHGDVDAFTKFELAIRHNILREIPGGYNPSQHEDVTGVCPEAGDQWYEMNDAPDLAAAQTAAAWLAGRDAAATLASLCDKRASPRGIAVSIRVDLTPPADASAALDSLIAERVRQAVEAEREACAKASDAAERVAHWLGRRKLSRGTDYEDIHGYDVSPDGGFYLRASDLEVLVRHASKEGR